MTNGAPVKTWLVESILVTLFCCLPLGVVGIVFAAMATSSQNAGNTALAAQQAGTAKTCTLIGFGVGLVGIVLYIALLVVGGLASGGRHP